MGIQNIANLVQGVSQQAAQQRRDSQCEEQFDCVNSAADGADARAPTELVKMVPSANWAGAFLSEFYYEGENYLLGYNVASGLFGINLTTGDPVTISVISPAVTGYLSTGSSDPEDKLRSQVVEDFVFVTNGEKVVAMSATLSDAKVNEAIVYVRATAFDTKYTVKLSGPASSTATVATSGSNVVPTPDIAEALRTGVGSGVISFTGDALNGVNGYTCTRSGSTLRIRRGDGAAFVVETEDGTGDDALLAFNGEAPSFEKLPARAFNGTILKVRGSNKTEVDDFYVKFTGEPSTGNWVETVAPATKTSLDPASLPHVLVRTAPDTFEFRRNVWSTRIAGDETTAKDPAIVGKTVRDVFFHQRRIAFLHRSGAVFAKQDFPYTLFPDTVQTVLDTAPVDIKVSPTNGDGVNDLRFAVQVQEGLYLWAQQQQHVVSHSDGDGFSQKTVETDPSTAYEFSEGSDPLPVGPFLFFASAIGDYFSVRALQFSGAKLLGDVDVTAHLPRYLRAGAGKMTASETLRMVFMLSKTERDAIYLLNYTHDGQQFIQQAINTWRIPGGDILWIGVRGNWLRIIQQRPEGIAFMRINLTPRATDGLGLAYLTRLDMRLTEADVTMSYDVGLNLTTINLPYSPTGPALRVITRTDKEDGFTRGREFAYNGAVDANSFTFKGDCTDYEFYIGQRISTELAFSEFFIRTENGSEPTDTLTVNRWSVSCSETGYTRLEVSVPNKDTKSYDFPARTLGGPSALTGTVVPSSGDVSAQVGHYAKDVRVRLVNDSYLPSRWQNGAVEYTATGWKGMK